MGTSCFFRILACDEAPGLFAFAQVKKLEENRAWFLGTVLLFRPPNAKSKEALASSQQQLKIGPHELTVKPESRDKALAVSSFLVSPMAEPILGIPQIELSGPCLCFSVRVLV